MKTALWTFWGKRTGPCTPWQHRAVTSSHDHIDAQQGSFERSRPHNTHCVLLQEVGQWFTSGLCCWHRPVRNPESGDPRCGEHLWCAWHWARCNHIHGLTKKLCSKQLAIIPLINICWLNQKWMDESPRWIYKALETQKGFRIPLWPNSLPLC